MKIQTLIPLVALTLATAFLSAADPLVVNVDEANPPFMYAQGGKAAGIYPALIGAAFKRLGVPVAVQPKPWKDAIQAMDGGLAGVGGIYKNAKREKKYDYSEPIFVERLVVYSSRKTPLNFTAVDDLKSRRVGVLRGWSYGDAFDGARKARAFTAEEADSDAQNFQKLDQGALDAVVAIHESGQILMTKYKTITSAATPLSASPTYLTFAKASGRQALLRQFDQAIKDMKASGEFQKLVQASLAQ